MKQREGEWSWERLTADIIMGLSYCKLTDISKNPKAQTPLHHPSITDSFTFNSTFSEEEHKLIIDND